MTTTINFVPTRQFWVGVTAGVIAILLVAGSIPNLMRRKISPYEARQMGYLGLEVEPSRDKFQAMELVARGGGGGGDRLEEQERKMVRTAAMNLTVKSPRDTSESIRQLAERMGGFLVNSEINGGQDASSALLQIRVPASKFEEARTEIRKLGLRVDSEKLNAEDVTKQYVDQAARLRNLRAQEVQYLGILKQAKTVKDTIEVSEKLDGVRGEIETQQAKFDALSKQVETVALTITLRAEAEAQVFGLRWRPLYQLKLAARQGIESIGDYALAMTSLLFYLPSILLWLATILLGAAVGWRILRWAAKRFFLTTPKVTEA